MLVIVALQFVTQIQGCCQGKHVSIRHTRRRTSTILPHANGEDVKIFQELLCRLGKGIPPISCGYCKGPLADSQQHPGSNLRVLDSELSTSWRLLSERNMVRVFQGWLGCEMGKLLPLGTDGLQFSRCETYRTEKHVCVGRKGDGD